MSRSFRKWWQRSLKMQRTRTTLWFDLLTILYLKSKSFKTHLRPWSRELYNVELQFVNTLFQSKYEFNVCLDHAYGKFLNKRSKSIDPDLVISVENVGSEPIYCSCSPAEYDEINSWLIENNRFDKKVKIFIKVDLGQRKNLVRSSSRWKSIRDWNVSNSILILKKTGATKPRIWIQISSKKPWDILLR